jgi:chromate transporter
VDRPGAVPARPGLLHGAARPEAQQLAVYTGWLLHGTRGGLVAGTLFVLPGVVTLLVLSAVYVAFGTTATVTALFAAWPRRCWRSSSRRVVRLSRRR